MPKLRDQEKTKERAKKIWVYNMVVTGKSLRAAKRHQENKAKDVTGNNKSMLGKMRSRQERKTMAKALKISFIPKYNGPTFRTKFILVVKDRPGKKSYAHLTPVVKEN